MSGPPFGKDPAASPEGDMAILQALESYWQTLRHNAPVPARKDINAQDLDAVLPYTFILQRAAPNVARFRVAGQKIHDLLRMDARGMPISVLFTPESRDRLNGLVDTAFMQPAIVAVALCAPADLLRPALQARMLCLPMRDHVGETSRVLGAIVASGMIGNKPRRFAIAPDHSPRVEDLLAADSQPQAVGATQRPPRLRLVVNND